jgi:hypothetical protein
LAAFAMAGEDAAKVRAPDIGPMALTAAVSAWLVPLVVGEVAVEAARTLSIKACICKLRERWAG